MMGNDIKGFAKEEWLDFEFVIKVWNMIRPWIKTKDFITPLKNMDYLNIKDNSVAKVTQIYQNDQWMSFRQIMVESQVSAYLFNWSQLLIQINTLNRQFRNLSLPQINYRIQSMRKDLPSLKQLHDKYLSKQIEY